MNLTNDNVEKIASLYFSDFTTNQTVHNQYVLFKIYQRVRIISETKTTIRFF